MWVLGLDRNVAQTCNPAPWWWL